MIHNTSDGRVIYTPEPEESNVDRAVRLHALYVAARNESKEAVTSLTDAEWREYIGRVGR